MMGHELAHEAWLRMPDEAKKRYATSEFTSGYLRALPADDKKLVSGEERFAEIAGHSFADDHVWRAQADLERAAAACIDIRPEEYLSRRAQRLADIEAEKENQRERILWESKTASALLWDAFDDEMQKEAFFHSKAKRKNPRVVELTTDEQKTQAAALETRVLKGPTPNMKHHRTFGIFDDGDLVAMTRVNLRPLSPWKKDDDYDKLNVLDPAAAISATAVNPTHRRRGFATKLKKHLQGEFDSLLTGTGPKSHESMARINSKLGFKPVLRRGKNTQYFWSSDEEYLSRRAQRLKDIEAEKENQRILWESKTAMEAERRRRVSHQKTAARRKASAFHFFVRELLKW
jgi:ribosomal protein S18 acetylase RimI-like enzyme